MRSGSVVASNGLEHPALPTSLLRPTSMMRLGAHSSPSNATPYLPTCLLAVCLSLLLALRGDVGLEDPTLNFDLFLCLDDFCHGRKVIYAILCCSICTLYVWCKCVGR